MGKLWLTGSCTGGADPRLGREIGALACINLTGYVHINTLIICRAEARFAAVTFKRAQRKGALCLQWEKLTKLFFARVHNDLTCLYFRCFLLILSAEGGGRRN